MTPDEIRGVLERLEAWAQNEEMIDGDYLAHGVACMEAASALRIFLWKQEQTRKFLGSSS